MYVMARNESAPSTPVIPGFYLRPRLQGFAVHLNANPQHLSDVRALTAKVLTVAGVDADTVESAQLVVSELVGNAVRAFGDWVPLVVEVNAAPFGVAVNVHDPDPRRLPRRRGVALDDAEAESGRGLSILDLLAPGWRIARSPIGKQVRCRLTCPDRVAAPV